LDLLVRFLFIGFILRTLFLKDFARVLFLLFLLYILLDQYNKISRFNSQKNILKNVKAKHDS